MYTIKDNDVVIAKASTLEEALELVGDTSMEVYDDKGELVETAAI